MTFFVDANVFLYAATPSEYQAPCTAVLQAVARGDAPGRTSTAALEEVWHVEWRAQDETFGGLTARAHVLMAPLLSVTDEIFARALALEASALGTNDRLHVTTCLEHEIETIVSTNSDFDGLAGIRRVDPLDAKAMEALSGSSEGGDEP